MHFGFGIITSFGFGRNFGSKSNQKPKFDDIPFSHYHLLRTKKNSNICSQTFFIKHFLNISGVGFKLVERTLSNQLFNSSSLDIEVLSISVSVCSVFRFRFRYRFRPNRNFGISVLVQITVSVDHKPRYH
jgi:hypothetical protein